MPILLIATVGVFSYLFASTDRCSHSHARSARNRLHLPVDSHTGEHDSDHYHEHAGDLERVSAALNENQVDSSSLSLEDIVMGEQPEGETSLAEEDRPSVLESSSPSIQSVALVKSASYGLVTVVLFVLYPVLVQRFAEIFSCTSSCLYLTL